MVRIKKRYRIFFAGINLRVRIYATKLEQKVVIREPITVRINETTIPELRPRIDNKFVYDSRVKSNGIKNTPRATASGEEREFINI
jgi:hypothetical protein